MTQPANVRELATVARTKMHANEQAAGKVLVERESQTRLMWVAVTAKEHVCFIGLPGIGKSYLIEAVTACFDPTMTVFGTLFFKAQPPEEVLGAYDIKEMTVNSVYKRNLAGGMASSTFAFLDEIWKGNSVVLNSLLQMLNERVLRENSVTHHIPLWSAFAASNEFPAGEELAALWDRFIFRDIVPPDIQSEDNLTRLLMQEAEGDKPKFKPAAKITQAELDAVHKDVTSVKIPKPIIGEFKKLVKKLAAEGIRTSPRRMLKALRCMRANAWYDGEYTVSVDDFEILQFVLWDTPKEREVCLTALKQLERTATSEIIEEIDALLRRIDSLPADIASRNKLVADLLDDILETNEKIEKQATSADSTLSKRGKAKVARRAAELGKGYNQLADEQTARLRRIRL